MASEMPGVHRLPTIGVIADQVGKKPHHVAYVVRSLGLKPIARAGVLRVFSEADVIRIKAQLASIAAARPASVEDGRD